MSSELEEHLKLSSSTINYQQIFKDELAKQDKDPSYKIDDIAIKEARKSLLRNYKDGTFQFEGIKVKAEELRKKFPEEFTKFSKLFNLLSRVENHKEFELQLQKISNDIGVKYDFLRILYQLHNPRQGESNKVENSDLEIRDIEEIISQLPKYKTSPKDDSVKLLGQILTEITLGRDQDGELRSKLTNEEINAFRELEKNQTEALAFYKAKYSNNFEVLQLIDAYGEVKEYYQKWREKDGRAIRDWADEQKVQGLSNVHEAIAVMDRANEHVTGGHCLRDTQILSVLAFLQTQKDQGRLCQISTGEGKTTIVSLLAVIKALQQEKVDVITSNPVLAAEGAKDKKDFYGLFGLTVSTNNIDPNDKGAFGPKDCYKTDVLYGCISNFQFDYLRDSFEGLKTRAGREFNSVILDEVDSMLIDNGGHIAKLSGPLPGMESLRYVYIKIWTELAKAEETLSNDYSSKLEKKAREIKDRDVSEEEAQLEYHQFQQELVKSTKETLKERVKASNPSKIELIPSHLQEYAKDKLDRWIDNAIYAKYSCHENKQYVIKQKDGETVVVPVDYANTGVTLKNTIWSHGLHQFVQLKHNLHLTSESLTSSFISNLGYIRKYDILN
ncbi:MAG: hypothetical protein DMENIID0002_03270 [Rickettsia endosymbiont of Sergentomyia squamirostris]|uniref:Protein translocase subunit SecA n=1 Tax=Candidatus Tisiphia endosymbiont of Sergentomyia squamirostris TaxID=3113639 RepID=A0AAT9G774_9RICK